MSSKERVCDVCGEEIPFPEVIFFCHDYKIRCKRCFIKFAGVFAS